MIECGSLINLACIQNEACLPRFENMITTWQIFAVTKPQYLNFSLQTI